MAKTEVFWVRPPSDLAKAVDDYAGRVEAAVLAVAQFMATKMQNQSRLNAPWSDRTGNARSGLFSVAEKMSRELVVIYISHGHTIEYGKWLELKNGGRYAIIWPTVEQHLPELKRMLDNLFK